MSSLSLTRFKRCTKCTCWLPAIAAFFAPHNRLRDGLQTRCRVCMRLWKRDNCDQINHQRKLYRAANKERIAEKWKRWYEENREARLEYHERWREENRELFLEIQRSYRQRNPKRYKLWRQLNPEDYRASRNRRTALEKLAPGDFSGDELQDMLESQQHLCAYCESPLFGLYHVEHMQPLSRGGPNDWQNIAIVCPPCNLEKANKTVEEFFNLRGRQTA